MNDAGEKKILKLLIAALIFTTMMLISLSILFALAFSNIKHDMKSLSRNADIVQAIERLDVINGKDGLSIQGQRGNDGINGKDSMSTNTIIQQPVNGKDGKNGKDGTPARTVRFDGLGNYRYEGDEVWLPLNVNKLPITFPEPPPQLIAPEGIE